MQRENTEEDIENDPFAMKALWLGVPYNLSFGKSVLQGERSLSRDAPGYASEMALKTTYQGCIVGSCGLE